ncbi:hypothetical protein LTR08_008397 [Meristemomyces frigidus]|nr:hypothetical protein LTR08_008397 [Meristemomyces frigidus]
MAASKETAKVKVIIVGGGIAGLTLANALQHGDTEYVLLEARDKIAPQLGASIGLRPNGSRILDQLGCYDDIMNLTDPIEFTASHRPDRSLMRPPTDAFQLVQARANYCMCFLDREAVLQVLADHIRDKDRILLTKRVRSIQHRADGVVVACEDGTSYHGDVVVGSDGVYSRVRQEMWRTANETSPGEISQREQESMTAEYKCLFGISEPHADLPSHHFDVTYTKDLTPIVITGKDERAYWFLIARMAEKYRMGNIPRFTRQDAQVFAEEHLDVALAPEGKKTYTLVALEEAYFSNWTWGRFALLGDSVHKMTPNMGSGGNCAIESAATLANALHELATHPREQLPTVQEVEKALHQYQQIRNLRASSTVRMSNYITRLHAVRSFKEKIVAYYVMPKAGDLLVDLASLSWIGATRIEHLDLPRRSFGGTMPFNPEQGLGRSENMVSRALLSTPLLALGIYHLRVLNRFVPRQAIQAAVKAGYLSLGHAPVRLWERFYRIPVLDQTWRGIVTLFLPSVMGFDPASKLQLSTALADFGTVYAIILIESARRANALTPMRI